MLTYYDVNPEVVYLLRMLSATICGALVGLEREKRQKSAGLRTHIIVCMASALMMIVSKYGFFDVIAVDGISLDASRIAAGVVTAIGFIGGGVIYIRKDNAVGLTTAAGLWATVGIGIALGAGMYVLGFSSTALMIIVQVIMHWKKLRVVSSAAGTIVVNMTKHHLAFKELTSKLDNDGMYIRNLTMSRNDEGEVILKASVMFTKKVPLHEIVDDETRLDYIDNIDLYTIN